LENLWRIVKINSMTQEEIIEGNNKLIGKFMGGHDNGQNRWYNIFLGQNGYYWSDQLKFHSSWEWLMSVVEKIESLEWNVNINKNCCIYDNQHKITACGKSITRLGDTKIESVWLAVVEFIKWYNKEVKK